MEVNVLGVVGREMSYESLQERDPDLALEWHETKNGSLLSTQVSVYSNTKVWWRCALGHEWDANISNRTGGRLTGCPKCSFNKGEARLEQILSTHELVDSHDKRTIECYDDIRVKWRKLTPDSMGRTTNGNKFMDRIGWTSTLPHRRLLQPG